MELDAKQINNLCTGVKLAMELESENQNSRRFLTIQGYSYNNKGEIIELKKVLNMSIMNNIYFELRCYEISNLYFANYWDVTEDDLINEIYKEDIEELEMELRKYIDDFSSLKPEWYCDSLL